MPAKVKISGTHLALALSTTLLTSAALAPHGQAQAIASKASPTLSGAGAPSSHAALVERAEALLSTQLGNYRIYRKILGRPDSKTYYVTVTASLFGFQPGGPSLPLATVIGLWASQMVDDEKFGGHFIRSAYCGTFVPFGTDTPVKAFTNPLTGREIKPQISKRSGAILIQGRRPSGIWYRSKDKGNVWDDHRYPFELGSGPSYPWQIIGNHLSMRENLVDWKAVKPRYEDMNWSAELSALMDDSQSFVPSSRVFGSTVRGSDFPFFDFGDKADTTFVVFHAIGRKVETLNEVPSKLLAFAKQECPAHLDDSVFSKSIAEVLGE